MPRIAAPTVAEHRALIHERLIDAAEQILRSDSPDRLTPAAVSAAAGIARNSIYRYVGTVDDLRAMVLARYLPEWTGAVAAALDPVSDPAERVATWIEANLREAGDAGHGWLMRIPVAPGDGEAWEQVEEAHRAMDDLLTRAWEALVPDPARSRLATAYTRAILGAGFRALDAGTDPGLVVETGRAGAMGLVTAYAAQDR